MKMNVDLPLFPGYVFVHISAGDKLRVLQAPSVARFIEFGGVPAPLPEFEVERLRAGLSRVAAEPFPFVRLGDRMRVKSGPLQGLEGTLISKKGSNRFIICMELIMRAIAVELDTVDLEPVTPRITSWTPPQPYWNEC